MTMLMLETYKKQHDLNEKKILDMERMIEEESCAIIGNVRPLLKAAQSSIRSADDLAYAEKTAIELTARRREWTAWFESGIRRIARVVARLSKTAKEEGIDIIEDAEETVRNGCAQWRNAEARRIMDANRRREEEARKKNEKRAKVARKEEKPFVPALPALRAPIEAADTRKGQVQYATRMVAVVVDVNKLPKKYEIRTWDVARAKADALAGVDVPGIEVRQQEIMQVRTNGQGVLL